MLNLPRHAFSNFKRTLLVYRNSTHIIPGSTAVRTDELEPTYANFGTSQMKASQTLYKMASQLPVLPEVEQLSTNVIRILGGNPSKFTLQGTNTYLLGAGPKRILLDTAQGLPQWASSLEKVLRDHSTSISTCLLSHWHHDHISGVSDLYKIQPSAQVHKNKPDLNPDNILDVTKVSPIVDGQTFTSEDFEVTAVHSPGHAADHMCLLVTASNDASEIGSLFTADNVLGHGTAVFENLGQYISTLALLRSKIGPGKRAYPGHGAVIDDGGERIDGYIQHRQMREDEAVNVLRYGRTSKPGEGDEMGKEIVAKEWGSMEMVKVIYRDVPENLHEPAEHGLKMVLQKLKEDGTVTQGAGGKWRIGEKAIL